MKPKNLILGLAVVIASFLFAACAGGKSNSGEFNITVDNTFMFDPSALIVTAGQEITITFTNEASVEHTFNILNASANLDQLLDGDNHEDDADDHEDDADDHEDGDDDHGDDEKEELHSQVLLEMHEVKPGESSTKTFTAPSEPGVYVIFCSLPGHADAGMVGTLTGEL